MNKALAQEFLFDIDDVFKKYNVTYWLDCGTLLGAVRDKDFIEWDDDLDLATYNPIFLDYPLWEQIIRDLYAKNIQIHITWGNSVFTLKKVKPGEQMTVDIHVYKKVNNEYQCAMSDNLFTFPEELFNSLDTIDFKGRKFNIPHNVDTYLSLFYGNNWKEPHKEIKGWTSKNCTPYYHSKVNSYIRNEPIFNPKFDKTNKISIIIPTYNKVKLLEHALNAYVNQNKPFNYEIIILNDYFQHDNTCTEVATETLVSKFLNKLNIFYYFTGKRNTSEAGVKWRIPGFAFNIGVKKATGNIILLACPEIYPMDKDCLLNVVKPLFSQNKIVTHPISVKDDKYWDENMGTCYGDMLAYLDANDEILKPTEFDYNRLEPLNASYPFFLAIHKKDYVDIGGYDEDFIGNCYDDADIYNRLKLNGCTFLPISGAEVLHLYHIRLNYKSEKVMKDQEYNKKLYYEREKIIIRNVGKDWGII